MNKQRVAELIRVHLDRYPESHIADVYKLLHQAVFGLGHLVANKKAAREWLENEAGKVTPTHEDLLVESVHPEAAIVRLHLRPYLAYGGKIKPLVDAMARSAAGGGGCSKRCANWARCAVPPLIHAKSSCLGGCANVSGGPTSNIHRRISTLTSRYIAC